VSGLFGKGTRFLMSINQTLARRKRMNCTENFWRSPTHVLEANRRLVSRRRTKSPEARQRRSDKWETSFISCYFHLDRRCNKSGYVCDGHRRCGRCKNRRIDGTLRPSYKESKAQNQFNRRRRESFNRDPMRFIKRQMNAPLKRLQRMVNGQ
jgi:hypothetical protein